MFIMLTLYSERKEGAKEDSFFFYNRREKKGTQMFPSGWTSTTIALLVKDYW